MTARRLLLRAVLAFVCAFAAWPAVAHENLPIVVDLSELTPGQFALKMRVPATVDQSAEPGVTLASPCQLIRQGNRASLFACPRDERPTAITVSYADSVPASAYLLRAEMLDGTTHSAVTPPGSTRMELPRAETPWGVIRSYLGIGIEHIAFGVDHLLFLVLLVLVAGTLRRTIATITGFTAGHALTITLATLGIVHVDGAVVEALIALSIVFVAVEFVRGQVGTLFSHYPAFVAAAFGTLHGLGFAGALADIGLARTSVPLSLIGFNLGVEIGQAAFILLVFGLTTALRQQSLTVRFIDAPTLRSLTINAIGIAAAFWFWERSFALVA